MPKYLTLSEWRIASSFGPSVVLEHVQRIDTEMGFPRARMRVSSNGKTRPPTTWTTRFAGGTRSRLP